MHPRPKFMFLLVSYAKFVARQKRHMSFRSLVLLLMYVFKKFECHQVSPRQSLPPPQKVDTAMSGSFLSDTVDYANSTTRC
jgi:hypothetical protein